MEPYSNRRHRIEIAVGGCFIAAIVATNIIAAKLIDVFGTTFNVGALVYPFTFLLTDILSEVFGKRAARMWVWLGFFASLIVTGFVYLGSLFPESQHSQVADCYTTMFAGTPRIVVGSMLAYLTAQTLDVRLFHWIRSKTGRRHLWLRNNVATSASQGVDTMVFCTVAFAGVVPFEVLVGMMVGQYLVKVGMAVVDTPLCYAAVWFVRRIAQ